MYTTNVNLLQIYEELEKGQNKKPFFSFFKITSLNEFLLCPAKMRILFGKGCRANSLNQTTVYLVQREDGGIANKYKLLTGTGKRHVQLSVYYCPLLHKGLAAEELELIGLANRKAIDDDIALAALVSLHRIHSDSVQFGYAQACYLLHHLYYL